MGQAHRLGLVVGHEDHRRPELALERLELGPGVDPQLGVEVRERLVHQEHPRLADDRPGQGDALLLAAGELGRPARQEVADPEQLGDRSTLSCCSFFDRFRTLSG